MKWLVKMKDYINNRSMNWSVDDAPDEHHAVTMDNEEAEAEGITEFLAYEATLIWEDE